MAPLLTPLRSAPLTPLSEANQALIARASRGNADAVSFLCDMVEVLHFWDDLVDGDHEISDAEINFRMWQALVLLPRNAFYRANFSELNPILTQAIHNWLAANVMERGTTVAGLQSHIQPEDAPIAFIIRSSYVDLISHVALLCGGFDHAQAITVEARRGAHAEGYHGYLDNLGQQLIDAQLLAQPKRE